MAFASLSLPAGWKLVQHPPSLFRRFEFGAYAETRTFLDRLAGLSERTGLYPDLGFGTKYVNATVHGADGNLPGTAEFEFAISASDLFDQPGPA